MAANPNLSAVDPLAVLDAMQPVVRREMLKEFTPDCCIATTRVLKRALAVFGIEAEPVAVGVRIYNAAMRRLLNRAPLPTDPRKKERLLALTGAWGIGICPHGNEERFGGHLVLRVGSLLVDASLQQAERPNKGILLDPLVVAKPHPAFFAPKQYGEEFGIDIHGCLVVYERIRDESFRRAPDWLRTGSPYTDVLRGIVSATKERLNQQ